MINYTKIRESFDKNPSKILLNKGLTMNKSHTSSINIKLSQDLLSYDNINIPLKSIVKEKYQPYLQTHTKQLLTSYKQQSKKNSVKLQSNQKENQGKHKEPFDISIVRPFQETNRYMETQRNIKQCSKNKERSLSKNSRIRLKTEFNEVKLKTEYHEASTQTTQKQSVKCLNDNGKSVKISVSDLHLLMEQLVKNHNDVKQLKKQLQFYHKLAKKQPTNSVLLALKN